LNTWGWTHATGGSNPQIQLVDTLVPCEQLYRVAFLLARTTRRPVYDMLYLALARREDASVLTADSGLRREAERQGIQLAR
jgi:predicted nucleic acid-binding protein